MSGSMSTTSSTMVRHWIDRRERCWAFSQCRPTLKRLIGQLDNVRKHSGGVELKVCYEASYAGFSLQWDLAERD